MYILISLEGQARYDAYEEARLAYEVLADKRGAYIKRVKFDKEGQQ